MKYLTCIISLLLYTMQMSAQETTRTIRGTVKDINGQPISEVLVLLSDTTLNNISGKI